MTRTSAATAAATWAVVRVLAAMSVLLASPVAAAAADLVPVECFLSADERMLPALRAEPRLAQLPVAIAPASLERRPRSGRHASAAPAVAALPGTLLRSPLTAETAAAVRERLQGATRCRVVLRAEGGLSAADLSALEQVGPCFFEVHAVAPAVFAERLSRLKPGAVFQEQAGRPIDPAGLAQLARLPSPVLATDASGALAAARLLDEAGSEVALGVRVPLGELPYDVLERLRAARRWPVVVVATRGLSVEAARVLRELPRLRVHVELEGLGRLPADLPAAVSMLLEPPVPVPQRAGRPRPR